MPDKSSFDVLSPGATGATTKAISFSSGDNWAYIAPSEKFTLSLSSFTVGVSLFLGIALVLNKKTVSKLFGAVSQGWARVNSNAALTKAYLVSSEFVSLAVHPIFSDCVAVVLDGALGACASFPLVSTCMCGPKVLVEQVCIPCAFSSLPWFFNSAFAFEMLLLVIDFSLYF